MCIKGKAAYQMSISPPDLVGEVVNSESVRPGKVVPSDC